MPSQKEPPLTEVRAQYRLTVVDCARLLRCSADTIYDHLVDDDGNPVKAYDVVEGRAWLEAFGVRIPVHKNTNDQVFFWNRQVLEAIEKVGVHLAT